MAQSPSILYIECKRTIMKKNIRLSIVEDVPSLRQALERETKALDDITFLSGYDNAEDALKGLAKEKPDIVIMDIGLPGMNGIECMLRAARKVPDISFLVFTVFESSEMVFDALKAGALGYILKRDGVDGIIQAVYGLAAGGSPMSREVARKVLTSFRPPHDVTEFLSPREEEILILLSKGLLYKEIAVRLNPQIGENSVRQHLHRIYTKLQVNNRTEAVNKYLGRAPHQD